MTNQELNILSITPRLQRLCETLRKDAGLIYKKYNANFMNKWYPVLITLNNNSSMSVTELASELGYAHPSVVQLINEMEQDKLIRSSAHKKDKRKRMVSLTAKGEQLRDTILPFADAMAESLYTVTKTENNIMKAIEEVEDRLQKESFFQRVDKALQKKHQ